MYSAASTVLLGVLAAAALVQGVAIGTSASSSSSSSSNARAAANVDPNNGVAVQSGYEGYVLAPRKPSASQAVTQTKLQIFVKSFLLPSLGSLARSGFKVFRAAGHLLLGLFLGVVATTAACSLTSLCTLSLALPALGLADGQSSPKQQLAASMGGSYGSGESLETVSNLVQDALRRYADSAAGAGQEAESQSAENAASASSTPP